MQKCLSGGESRLGGDEGPRGGGKERIKRINNAYVPDKERSTNGHCRTSNGSITGKTNMYRIRNGQILYRTVKERIYRSRNG